MTPLDYAVVLVYLLASVGLGAWLGRHQKSTTDYFLGGRQLPWPAVTFSVVATETSVLTFISIPTVAYLGDLRFVQIVFGYMVGRLVVAALLIPAYFRGKLVTAYHFLGQRFGDTMRRTTSVTFMVTRLLADGVRLFATAIPLAMIFKSSPRLEGLPNTDAYVLAIGVIAAATVVYTFWGGIRAVIWMDVLQMAVYLLGAALAAAIILNRVPHGLSEILATAKAAGKLDWFYLGTDLTLSEFIKQPYTFFTGLITGGIFSVASHGVDQLIMQRILTCRDVKSGQKAMAASGPVVLVQFLIFLAVGILLWAFYEGRSPQELGLQQADGLFPKFIVEEMPAGVSGLILAALFAAAMSTLSSSLSSLASATVLDLYVPLARRVRSEAELLRLSRWITLGWGVLLMGTALAFIGLKGTAVELALGVASYTYGGLLGVFLLGLLFEDVSQKHALWGFAVALVTMTVVIQTVQIAWPFYTVIGAGAAVLTGWLASRWR